MLITIKEVKRKLSKQVSENNLVTLLRQLEYQLKAKCEQTVDELECDDWAVKHGMIVTMRKDIENNGKK